MGLVFCPLCRYKLGKGSRNPGNVPCGEALPLLSLTWWPQRNPQLPHSAASQGRTRVWHLGKSAGVGRELLVTLCWIVARQSPSLSQENTEIPRPAEPGKSSSPLGLGFFFPWLVFTLFSFLLHEVFSQLSGAGAAVVTFCSRVFKKGRKEVGGKKFFGICFPPHASVGYFLPPRSTFF